MNPTLLVNAMNLLQQFEAEQITRTLPKFGPGDTVVVNVKVKEAAASACRLTKAWSSPRRMPVSVPLSPWQRCRRNRASSVCSSRTADHRFGRGQAPWFGAWCQALLPARAAGQEGTHQGRLEPPITGRNKFWRGFLGALSRVYAPRRNTAAARRPYCYGHDGVQRPHAGARGMVGEVGG